MFAYAVRKESLWFKPGSKEPYKLSRTRIDNYTKCKRCFWLEERYGVKRPDSFPLTLNIAVDALLKKEFDIHREGSTPHPLMEAYGIKAVPFAHEKMDEWRANFTGVRFVHKPTNLLIFGAVDDIWINDKGELHVVDYKATAKQDTPTLDGDLGAQYKRQMEVYQWLLRQNGFKVSDTGYFVYVNGKKDAKAFDAKLEFDVIALPCKGDDSWIEPILAEIKETLLREEPPERSPNCDYCGYREAAGKTLIKTAPKKEKSLVGKKLAKKNESEVQESLF
ncbi:MAG TPA: PD-(D/E)XK nuclease family protein [Candidatus Paceibacterota bacterium]|nr:PD-(D/E)XK nuclease family protein [Candidatus Paceibacterota bacterium]